MERKPAYNHLLEEDMHAEMKLVFVRMMKTWQLTLNPLLSRISF